MILERIAQAATAVIALSILNSCGSTGQPTQPSPSPIPEEGRTCASIRSEVVRIAATNGLTIVKIYDAKTLKSEPKMVSCSGRALVGNGEEATIYYRDYEDEDGDWLVQYAEHRFE